MVLLVASAQATYHLNMVNEVMLTSRSGDPSVQFVEFLDNGGSEEAFTPAFAPYKLVIYDAAGNKLGEQTLDPTGLRAAALADREYLVSTPGADSTFHVAGDERLNTNLPLQAGQACFEGNTSPPTAVSCLTWGTINQACGDQHVRHWLCQRSGAARWRVRPASGRQIDRCRLPDAQGAKHV